MVDLNLSVANLCSSKRIPYAIMLEHFIPEFPADCHTTGRGLIQLAQAVREPIMAYSFSADMLHDREQRYSPVAHISGSSRWMVVSHV